MKIIALEEHFVTDEVMRVGGAVKPRWRDASGQFMSPDSNMATRLGDLGDERLRLMDDSGVDVQVLSLTTPGVQNLEPGDARDVAHRINDLVATTVAGRPDRFQGFATLPTPDPAAAARELERAVTRLGLQGAMIFGRTRARNADSPEFTAIYEAAASLRVPLYLHPQIPDQPVRESYYAGLGDEVDLTLAMGGIGWHYDTGVQLLRMILSGVFDRFPDLQIITGHWGEAVLFYLERIDVLSKAADKLDRPVSDYFRTNVYVTPSGIFSQRYLRWATEVVGVDRILFSTDYPYVYQGDGWARAFLDEAELSGEDRSRIRRATAAPVLHGRAARLQPDPRARGAPAARLGHARQDALLHGGLGLSPAFRRRGTRRTEEQRGGARLNHSHATETLMTTLDPNDNYLILINTFEVSPENADKLVDILHEASGPIGKMQGFVSANLHVSSDKKRVVNYVQWRTRADFEAMQKNPDAQPHMKEAADLAESYDPVFYDLRYVVGEPSS